MSEENIASYWKAKDAYIKAVGVLKDQLKEAEDARTFLQLGQLYLLMEEYEEAETSLRKAVEKDAELSEAYAGLGVVYTRNNDYPKAIKHYEAALRRNPDNLSLRSKLAESYLKAGLADQAEIYFGKNLAVTYDHVESHIGLGEVYTTMGDAGDEERYDEAAFHLTEAIKLIQLKRGSRRFKRTELATVFYSRGYVKVKLYEASRSAKQGNLLREALEDFKNCLKNDPHHHIARRTVKRLEEKTGRLSQRLVEKVGPALIVLCSLFVFVMNQISFFWNVPNKSINVGYYALLSFGSLIFMVAGLYLRQVMKIKIAGIELEKSPVEQIMVTSTVGITRLPLGSLKAWPTPPNKQELSVDVRGTSSGLIPGKAKRTGI
ncbi:MAG TPA: tetratricopeptide repeat protein [Blastocatellia bacterium]|nr:tetratricopeptide repeat protein [Blastocatellia bacterium]